MALKITTQIGTDKGITSEAYVRISNYQLHKSGSATFNIEIYQNEEDAPSYSSGIPTIYTSQSQNQQIGNSISVSLTTQIEESTTYPMGGTDSNGDALPPRVETITRTIPDLSSAQGVDIFTFGYTHLKAKLVDLFGAQNVVDC